MTKARDTANLVATGVPNSLITLDAAEIPNLAASKITSGTLDNARITLDAAEIPNISTDKLTTGTLANARVADLPTSKITSGTFADARISSSSVTAHVDLTPVRQDVLLLALKQAVQENSAKFNLANSAITKFEADADFNSGGSTNATRNVLEYMWAATTSSTAITISKTGSPTHSTSYAKWGTSSLNMGTSASDYIHWDVGATHMDFEAESWTIEMQYLFTSNSTWLPVFQIVANSDLSQGTNHVDFHTWDVGNRFYPRYASQSTGMTNIANNSITSSLSTGTWYHFAICRNGINFTLWVNGTEVSPGNAGMSTYDFFSMRYGVIGNKASMAGYFDDFRVSDTARYTNGTNFTAPASRFSSDSNTKLLIQSINQSNGSSTFVDTGPGVVSIDASATGTALGTTNVPTSAVTDVSGVMLLKNAYGTNTLGTDVKVYFTADNSAWTEATSYADAGTFSTGIKMIKLGKTTCTSGSDVRWKVVWANQSASSKEGHIYGIGLNY